MNYFLTGTDTDVGKTYVTSLLVRGLRRGGLDAVAMKPICCGNRSDSELLHEACGKSIALDDVNPVWLSTPAAPFAAAEYEGRGIDLDLIRATFTRLRRAHPSILVEGVGGWLVPIKAGYFGADLARDLGLPVVVVVRNRLGALNHTLLTLESIRSHGLQCAGIILNNMDGRDEITASNRSVFGKLLDVPVLFEIEKGQQDIELGIA